jgi:integrase
VRKPDEIDFRFVPGPKLAKSLIDAVGEQGERGRHLMAFFGCLYYAANRPGEAASLREDDFILPEEGWGEVLLSTSMPRVGSCCTDTGESFDTRGLKKRARKATRPVPIPPVLVPLIREHIKEFGTAKDGRLFRAAQGGHLLSRSTGRHGRLPGSRCSRSPRQPRRWLTCRTPCAMRASHSGLSPVSPRPRCSAGGPQHRCPVPLLRQGHPSEPGALKRTDPACS